MTHPQPPSIYSSVRSSCSLNEISISCGPLSYSAATSCWCAFLYWSQKGAQWLHITVKLLEAWTPRHHYWFEFINWVWFFTKHNDPLPTIVKFSFGPLLFSKKIGHRPDPPHDFPPPPPPPPHINNDRSLIIILPVMFSNIKLLSYQGGKPCNMYLTSVP